MRGFGMDVCSVKSLFVVEETGGDLMAKCDDVVGGGGCCKNISPGGGGGAVPDGRINDWPAAGPWG